MDYAFLEVGAGPFPAFAAAHLAFIEAASFARTAAETFRFFGAEALGAGALGASAFFAAGAFEPFTFAQRRCCAARIFARAWGDSFLRLRFPVGVASADVAADFAAGVPRRIAAISASRAVICSAMETARLSCVRLGAVLFIERSLTLEHLSCKLIDSCHAGSLCRGSLVPPERRRSHFETAGKAQLSGGIFQWFHPAYPVA